MSHARVYNKGIAHKISNNLNTRELDCKCEYDDCTFTILNEILLVKWLVFRTKMGMPVHINSSYRCKKHNKDVGSTSKDSRHVRGSGMDLALVSGNEQLMIRTAKDVFPFVKIYNNFIHVDVRDL